MKRLEINSRIVVIKGTRDDGIGAQVSGHTGRLDGAMLPPGDMFLGL
jgi:hypothetical protein